MSVALLSGNTSTTSNFTDEATTVTLDNVGIYVGFLGTAFTAGRCLGFVPWKHVRNHIGGRATLALSLFLSAVCSVWFGLCSRTFSSALVARFFLGFSNAISGCVKRAAIERERQTSSASSSSSTSATTSLTAGSATGGQEGSKNGRAAANVLHCMWWGSAVGPAVGGLLADPKYDYGSRPEWTEQHPFLLPNLVAAALCVLSMAAVFAFVEEFDEPTSKSAVRDTATTAVADAEEQRGAAAAVGEKHPLLPKEDTTARNVRPPSDDSVPSVTPQQPRKCRFKSKKKKAAEASAAAAAAPRHSPSAAAAPRHSRGIWEALFAILWKGGSSGNDSAIRAHLVAYWSFSFVFVMIDEALPLFLVARAAGPGLSASSVGCVLSAAGLTVVLSQQASLGRRVMGRLGLGLYRRLRLGAVLGNVPAVLIPLALLWEKGPDMLTWPSLVFLAVLAGVLRTFASRYFDLMGMATGQLVIRRGAATPSTTTPTEVAHIMTMGALGFRAVAPVASGILVSFFLAPPSSSSSQHPHHGLYPYDSAVYGLSSSPPAWKLWAVIGLLFGLSAAAFTFSLKESVDGEAAARHSAVNSKSSERRTLYLIDLIQERSQYFDKLWEVHFARSSGKKNEVPEPDGGDDELETGIPKKPMRLARHTSWIDHILRPGVDLDEIPFLILGTHKHDKSCLPHALTPPLMEALHKHLPAICSGSNFWLKYSLARDGASLAVLEAKIALSKHTFMVIETLHGHVFGCFMTKRWERRCKYKDDRESFLWRMNNRRIMPPSESSVVDEKTLGEIATVEGDIEVFPWTGKNDLCQLLTYDKIACGGGTVGLGDGFGIAVQDDLMRGSSSPCITYGNPCLCPEPSQDGAFEVANIEMWSMTPHMFVADAEKGEYHMKFFEENPDSAFDNPEMQGAWSNFI
eukprot:CAMPEP_0194348742 /NCGR_PEP_ID=MMETSP0171-20130528/106694_1 /TAXON_ID=218684 /ORGANISM="Corethron pennatum, Strain L29A3" /LENGTH=912 /DNA_ID=CAMNT_0039116105 /DNA_START=156 /DNA_END=2894 /DNA_ORIENTATION=-